MAALVRARQTFSPCLLSPPAHGCSPREEEILALLAKGFRYKEIAEALDVSVETVRTHFRRIYERLHVSSRTEAVVKFLGKQPPAAPRHHPPSAPNHPAL